MKPDRKFTSILRDLAENSSLHGIPKTVSSKQKPVQVLWCLLFLATFTVFGLQLYQLFSAYYSWPVQTAVSLKFSALQYPAVTFCNMNPVKLSQIDTYPSLKEVINPKVVSTLYSYYHCSFAFCLTFEFLSPLVRIASQVVICWEMAFRLCCFKLDAILSVCVPFPFGVLGGIWT